MQEELAVVIKPCVQADDSVAVVEVAEAVVRDVLGQAEISGVKKPFKRDFSAFCDCV